MFLRIYGFKISDRSDYGKTCYQLFSTNFSAWIRDVRDQKNYTLPGPGPKEKF
jgi:hypothetical protein